MASNMVRGAMKRPMPPIRAPPPKQIKTERLVTLYFTIFDIITIHFIVT